MPDTGSRRGDSNRIWKTYSLPQVQLQTIESFPLSSRRREREKGQAVGGMGQAGECSHNDEQDEKVMPGGISSGASGGHGSDNAAGSRGKISDEASAGSSGDAGKKFVDIAADEAEISIHKTAAAGLGVTGRKEAGTAIGEAATKLKKRVNKVEIVTVEMRHPLHEGTTQAVGGSRASEFYLCIEMCTRPFWLHKR